MRLTYTDDLASLPALHKAAKHVILPEKSWWPCGAHSLGEVQDVGKKLDVSQAPPSRHIVITSYDLAQKLRGYERHFGMVICDESHALKNPASKRTQFFRALLGRGTAKRVLFLTGTPALSRPIELFTQVSVGGLLQLRGSCISSTPWSQAPSTLDDHLSRQCWLALHSLACSSSPSQGYLMLHPTLASALLN